MSGTTPRPPEAALAAAADTRLSDRVLGVLGGAMVLMAVVLFFVGGPEDGVALQVDAPVLELVQPKHGITVQTENLPVVFRVEGELRQSAGGWGLDSLHLHLSFDGVELMPAPADIEPLPGGLYRWTLAKPEPGLHTLRLLWSGPDHRAIRGAESRTVQVRVAEPGERG